MLFVSERSVLNHISGLHRDIGLIEKFSFEVFDSRLSRSDHGEIAKTIGVGVLVSKSLPPCNGTKSQDFQVRDFRVARRQKLKLGKQTEVRIGRAAVCSDRHSTAKFQQTPPRMWWMTECGVCSGTIDECHLRLAGEEFEIPLLEKIAVNDE